MSIKLLALVLFVIGALSIYFIIKGAQKVQRDIENERKNKKLARKV